MAPSGPRMAATDMKCIVAAELAMGKGSRLRFAPEGGFPGAKMQAKQLDNTCALPVFQPPPILLGRGLAEVPVAVFPLELDRTPAERNLRERVNRPNVRPGVIRIGRRIRHARVIVVRGVGRPSV